MKHIQPVLAAWLHDIGKFAQRANAPCTRGMEQEYCPGGTSHRHVLYTDYFIEHVLPLPPELEGSRGTLARMAAAHHRPDTFSREEMALQKADWLSSGGDRIEGDAEGDYKSARLESIFVRVHLGGKGLPEGAPPRRYRLRPLLPADAGAHDDRECDEPIFPVEDTGGYAYPDLFRDFCAALKKLPLDMGAAHYMASLASLLEQYTWCIPSSTYNTRADISLYDHSATTAAIAQALLACPPGEERLLLAGGEISGIQKFIFGADEQADKGASKLLRARSLYLQALTRSVWLALLEKLGLGHAARIMDAGGRFILLLPDTDESRRVFTTLRHDVETWLLTIFQGTVRMNFASLPLLPEDLQRERFCGCFERFNTALEHAKAQPFATVFAEGVSPVMPVKHTAYTEHGECAFCRSRPAKGQLDNEAICPLCRKLIEQVGRRLPTAHYLVFTREADGLPLFDGLRLRLEKRAEAEARSLRAALDVVNMRDYGSFSAAPVAGYVPRVTDADMARWKEQGRLHKREGADCFADEPVKEGEPKTFAMLAEEARVPVPGERSGWRSVACLAACKADVDNLGMLLGMGFGVGKESQFSISRFAMLSRMLNHFFAARVPRLIARDFPNIYVIFAGGDDLFTLGPWSEIVDFALRLRADFARFTGGNPAVTFSAGLPVCKPRLPVRALRRAAETALEQSKDHPGKDAATLFDVTASWDDFARRHEEGQWLEGLCLKGDVTQGLVRRLLGYARECRDFNRGDIRKGLYLSHMAYDVQRNCDPKKILAEDLARLRGMGQDKDTFPRAEMGITWALYRTRTTG